MQARLAVRRYAVNVNQGIAALHSGAGAPVCLQRAAADCDRAVIRLDEQHGLAADHTAPRLIAAWDSDLTRLEPAETATGRPDVRASAAALAAPVAVANIDPASKPVHHLAIAAAKDPGTGQLLDKMLSDGQWADIAAEDLHQLGLAKRGDEQAVPRKGLRGRSRTAPNTGDSAKSVATSLATSSDFAILPGMLHPV